MSGKLLAIATHPVTRADLVETDSIEIKIGSGCDGDFRGKLRDRSVTILAKENWELACQEVGQEIPWTARRANLLVEGLQLSETTGSQISIGDVVLEVTGECDPCRRMDEIVDGLKAALQPDWRGGVCCRVLRSGDIAVGDQVQLSESAV